MNTNEVTELSVDRGTRIEGKEKSTSLASAFFILAIIAFSTWSFQGLQATQQLTNSLLLVPPPPSVPYWTYKTAGVVRAVAVSEDGSTVVVGSYDSAIYAFGRQSNATL